MGMPTPMGIWLSQANEPGTVISQVEIMTISSCQEVCELFLTKC